MIILRNKNFEFKFQFSNFQIFTPSQRAPTHPKLSQRSIGQEMEYELKAGGQWDSRMGCYLCIELMHDGGDHVTQCDDDLACDGVGAATHVQPMHAHGPCNHRRRLARHAWQLALGVRGHRGSEPVQHCSATTSSYPVTSLSGVNTSQLIPKFCGHVLGHAYLTH